MKSETLSRVIGPVVTAAAVALAAGCATPLGSRITADPGIGYWMAATAGNTQQQDSHATRVASAEFQRRVAGTPSTLHELRAYRARLLATIKVPTVFPAGSPDLRGVSPADIERMEEYAAAHKDAGTVMGAKYCVEWADELAKLAPLMTALEARVDQLVRGAEEKLRQGNMAEAEASWQEARSLDHDGANVLGLEKKIVVAKARGPLGALPGEIKNNFLKKAEELQKKFATPDSNEATVTGCLAVTADADKAVERFRETLKTADGQWFSADDVEKALQAPEKDIATVRGRCWAEQVRLLAADGKFWPAHQYADQKIGEAAGTAEHRRTAAVGPLAESYRQILLPAVSKLVTQANSQLDRDACGIALTFCRMAGEMTEFARVLQLPAPAEVATWEKRCAESKSDAQKKIAATVQRRLLLGDFNPQTTENRRLSARVLDRCAELLSEPAADGTRTTHHVVVEKLGEKIQDGDYVIECNVPDFLIINAPSVEVERAVVKVGRDIREIPNPQYGPETKNVPKTLFSQEVYCYQSTRRQYAKKTKLRASLTCACNESKRNLLSLDVEFGEGGTDLEEVRMSGVEEQLDTPFFGPARTSPTRSGLTVDPWPKAIPATLSSDAEITEAVQKYAADRIADAIVACASGYPVDVLAAEAVRHGKLGNKYEAADYWGQCLEYCSQLCSGKENSSWIVQRNRMLGRIAELCRTTWKNKDGEVLKKISNLWAEAVQSAAEAVR